MKIQFRPESSEICVYNIKRGSGRHKMHAKSLKDQFEIDAWKRHEKYGKQRQNETEKRFENMTKSKIWQNKHMSEMKLKLDAKKPPQNTPGPSPAHLHPPFPRFARADAPTEAPGLKSGFRDIEFWDHETTRTTCEMFGLRSAGLIQSQSDVREEYAQEDHAGSDGNKKIIN